MATESRLAPVPGPVPRSSSSSREVQLPEAFTSTATHFTPIILTSKVDSEKSSQNLGTAVERLSNSCDSPPIILHLPGFNQVHTETTGLKKLKLWWCFIPFLAMYCDLLVPVYCDCSNGFLYFDLKFWRCKHHCTSDSRNWDLQQSPWMSNLANFVI